MIRKRHKTSAVASDTTFPNPFDLLMAKATWSRHSPPSSMRPRHGQRPPAHFQPSPIPPSHAPPPWIHQTRRNGRVVSHPRHSPHKTPYAIPSRRGMQDPVFDQGPSLPQRNHPYQARPKKRHHQSQLIPPPKTRPPQKENKSQPPKSAFEPQEQINPKPKSESDSPAPTKPSSPPPSIPKMPCSTPPKPNADPWRIHYLLEKERLSPSNQKSYAIHFFHADQGTTKVTSTTESKFTAHRTVSAAYTPEQLFGLGPSRKVEVRDVPVTFSQIWNREVIWRKWDAMRQDQDGWLDFRQCSSKMQLQRQHGPGTLFFVQEGGDESVLEEEGTAVPDVAFRLVDAAGQRFTRVNKWDLQTTVYGSCGEGVVIGVDGKEIRFEIEEGARQVRIAEEGMPSEWEGKWRGDLIVDIVWQQ